jgi:hypothetical protein
VRSVQRRGPGPDACSGWRAGCFVDRDLACGRAGGVHRQARRGRQFRPRDRVDQEARPWPSTPVSSWWRWRSSSCWVSTAWSRWTGNAKTSTKVGAEKIGGVRIRRAPTDRQVAPPWARPSQARDGHATTRFTEADPDLASRQDVAGRFLGIAVVLVQTNVRGVRSIRGSGERNVSPLKRRSRGAMRRWVGSRGVHIAHRATGMGSAELTTQSAITALRTTSSRHRVIHLT